VFYVGGYPGQAYSNATALIITMLLNNDPNTTAAAEAWELNFLQRIQTAIATNAYPLLNISYSAQVLRGFLVLFHITTFTVRFADSYV
jgi:hypothetical protein